MVYKNSSLALEQKIDLTKVFIQKDCPRLIMLGK